MTNDPSTGLYPRYCLHLSPTFNAWCLLQASDIHALRSVPDFKVQDFYFHKNLPIKWVRITGIIVAVDDFPGRRIYTVDDSSGACIECVAALKTPPIPKDAARSTSPPNGLPGVGSRPQPQPPTDCAAVDVGTVVDIKGGLTTFRDEKQVKIEKLKVLRSTEQEVALWERRTQFRNDILLQPWVLSEKQIRRCKREEMRENGDEDEEEKRKKRRAKRQEEKQKQKQKQLKMEMEAEAEAEDRERKDKRRRAKAAADAERERYRIYKLTSSKRAASGGRDASSSKGLLRQVLDESIQGKCNTLGL